MLALPAVGGKFGVRGGGFSMSNSTAFGIKAATWMNDTPEPQTRIVNMNKLGDALLDYSDPAVEMLFVYNCNPLATMPNQNRVLEGLRRSDLFTVVFDQVFTDTARYADVVLPATTFLENYDIARGYGPISLQLVRPAIEPAGEARPNPAVFSELAQRLGIGEVEEETDTLLRIAGRLPPNIGSELLERGSVDAAVWRTSDSVRRRVSADARREDRPVSGGARCGGARRSLRVPARPGDRTVSSRPDFPRQRKDGVVDARRTSRASGHAADAPVRRRRHAGSRPTTRSACSTISARCSAPSPSRPTSGPGRSASPRGCGARAPTTDRPRMRSRRTR